MVKKAKKIFALCLSFAMLFACVTFSANATSGQYFTIDQSVTKAKGASFSLAVKMSDVKLLKGVQGTVSFDPSVLTLESVTPPATDAFASPVVDPDGKYDQLMFTNISSGSFNFLAARETAYSDQEASTPTIMILNFKVNDSIAEDTYANVVSFSNYKGSRDGGASEDLGTAQATTLVVAPNAPAVTANDKINDIVGYDKATMEYAVSPDYAVWTSGDLPIWMGNILGFTGNKTVKVRFKGQTATTDLVFTPDMGDINDDGGINVTDIGLILNIILGNENGITPEQKARANVNGDTKTDVTDIGKVLNRVLNVWEDWPTQQ